MPSSKDAKKSRNTNRLSSGIEELDHILGGGFPAKRAIAGRIRLPGSQKSGRRWRSSSSDRQPQWLSDGHDQRALSAGAAP